MKQQSDRKSPARRCLALVGLLLLTAGALPAQTGAGKRTEQVAMRDGTLLATDIYLPAGAGLWPVALLRTPFDKNAMPANPFLRVRPADLVRTGIAAVVQDTRGRFASQGQARLFVHEGWGEHQDGADTVAWIRQQPWSNGKIATFGPSYMGSTQYLLAGAEPEGIVGQHVVTAPISPYHSWVYQNGVFRKAATEEFVSATGFPREALEEVRRHPGYDDFWRALDLRTRAEQVRWPILHLGGWFDVFIQGTIDAFTELQKKGGDGARGRQRLVIGPWTHLALRERRAGELTFPRNAIFPPGAPDELQWLSFWLKGTPQIAAEEPAVRYYVMGDVTDPAAPGNVWRAAAAWPPPRRARSAIAGREILAPARYSRHQGFWPSFRGLRRLLRPPSFARSSVLASAGSTVVFSASTRYHFTWESANVKLIPPLWRSWAWMHQATLPHHSTGGPGQTCCPSFTGPSQKRMVVAG
jgi:predicted acyl esterase